MDIYTIFCHKKRRQKAQAFRHGTGPLVVMLALIIDELNKGRPAADFVCYSKATGTEVTEARAKGCNGQIQIRTRPLIQAHIDSTGKGADTVHCDERPANSIRHTNKQGRLTGGALLLSTHAVTEIWLAADPTSVWEFNIIHTL
eukprot:scaffold195733_cov17-Prasinocladus_malaysianus.AAC.1